MRKNHSKFVCIKLVHLPYLTLASLLAVYANRKFGWAAGVRKEFCVICQKIFRIYCRKYNSTELATDHVTGALKSKI